MKERLHISVRTLVELVLRSGDLSFEFSGPRRPVEAIRAHVRIQKSRPAEYAHEVPVSRTVESDRFVLDIGGRIDGVYTWPDRVVIDEIKTTVRDLDRVEQEENPLHWGQLKAYAFMYAEEHGLDEVWTQLTYFHMDTEGLREVARRFSREELADFFNDLVARYLKWAEALADWREIRNRSLHDLAFPFDAFRAGQRRMAVQVYRTAARGGQFIAQAPTGIGKTMAAVFPALKALGEGRHEKIFYLTARTTGRAAAEKACADLRRRGARVKTLTLTAKDKVCFEPEAGCGPEECPYAKGHFDRVARALEEAFAIEAVDRQAIEDVARRHQVCPFELSLDLALWTDCLICDYNYVFDPTVCLRRFFVEEKGDYTFLIDEAHNLVDRSREMFSARLDKQAFLDLRPRLKADLPEIHRSLGRVNAWMVSARKACGEAGGFLAERAEPDELYPRLKTFLKRTEAWLARNLPAPYKKDLLDLYFQVHGFMRVAERFDSSYITCREQSGRDLRLKLFCLDPSTQMAEALTRCRAAVFFSATMTPTEYFREVLGCHDEAARLVLPSPFDPDNLCLMVLDRISTLYKNRDRTKEDVARTLAALVGKRPGNYLLFFPSYEYKDMVRSIFEAETAGEVETLDQRPGMSEAEREAFLERFSSDNPGVLVGFAVMGGIFGEGIDLVGDRLTGAVIVGVGLPGISPERDLIREHFAQSRGAGFEFAYLYPGINRVLQAAGRVIRSETDRGVVLLIDERFSWTQYRALLPREWRPVRVSGRKGLEAVLERFWGRGEARENIKIGKVTKLTDKIRPR
ncbi:MAG: ATP-dependent DNA helicase [Proteobacteria bacterium]|nr:ATP-dependent DNA helicase [Pseudomonadota bacterium]